MRPHPALLREPHLNGTGGAAAAAALVSAALAAAGSGLVVRLGPVDRPGARASHVRPTATSGGVAVLVAAGLGALLFARLQPGAAAGWTARNCGLTFALAAGFGLFGAADDRWELGARLKLGLGAVLALGVGALLPPTVLPLLPGLDLPLPPLLGAAGAALWIVTAANAVNFVDGANGLAPGGLLIAFATLAIAAFLGGAPMLGAVALATAAAYAGFLPWNLAGRLFQGDAGALFGGLLFAVLHLVGVRAGVLPLYFGPVVLLPWLTDVLLTLLRRARGGRSLLDAHREHLYQRWLQATGRPHLALAWRAWIVFALAGAAGLGLTLVPRGWTAPLLALAVAAHVLAWTRVSRALDRRLGPSAGD